MPKFNRFSEEVHKELQKITDYGGPAKAPHCGDTYKAQALRFLAEKLWYEEKVEKLERRLGAALDIIDCFDVDEFVRISGYNKELAQALFNKFKC